jgi:hypothetical protein
MPQGDSELMAQEQVLGFKPPPRHEKIDDEHSERVQHCEHRHQACNDSASRRESQVGWNFRKGQVSHPFVERLIGTIRREFLDHLIWNAVDLERKLDDFRTYYNDHRAHQSLNGSTPGERSGQPPPSPAVLARYVWRHHCGGLFQMPIAA